LSYEKFGFQHGKAKRGNSGEASGVRFSLAEDGDPLQEQWARRDIFGFESQAAGLAVHIPSAKAGGLRE
jgi:hypothetical protein